jgi:outer membrane protein
MAGASMGTFKHLPPSLLLQYHFTGLNGYKPYVGAGVNYTRITSVNLLDGGATLEDHSWGGALQVGLDIPLDKNGSLNFDLKKVYIRSDVSLGTANQGALKLDPVWMGVGLGYRF